MGYSLDLLSQLIIKIPVIIVIAGINHSKSGNSRKNCNTSNNSNEASSSKNNNNNNNKTIGTIN